MLAVLWHPADFIRAATTIHPDDLPREELSVKNGAGISRTMQERGITPAAYMEAFPGSFWPKGWKHGDPSPASWDVPTDVLMLPGRAEELKQLAAMLGEPLEVLVYERPDGFRNKIDRYEPAV